MITIFKLLGALALLIFGMKTMSEALQKMAGPQLRHVLGAMTTNRFTGLLTGMFVTVAVQSSAATTVMTVSFVNAGLLSLAQAISVIMGANIGTTLSAWIMSAGFSFNITNFVWPAFLLGIILIHIKKRRYVGDFLFGLSFLFFALGTLNITGRELDLAHNTALISFFTSFDSGSYLTILVFLLIGTVLTVIAQSSAALMAITMVLCTSGVLPIYQGIALVMGENIGTTLTANFAALSANVQARRAAFAHLLFNIFGVFWVLCLFYPFVNMVCGFAGIDPTSSSQEVARLSFALATFHTAFNVTNTLILIWFVPVIEKICCRIIKPRESDDEETSRLRYIQSGIMKTPELSVFEAQQEIGVYVERTDRMLKIVREMLDIKDAEQFEKEFERVRKYEGISDNMEAEIGKYLAEVSDAHLSDDTKGKIRAMLREINEIESIGDSCYALARTLNRKRGSNVVFTEAQDDSIRKLFSMLDGSMSSMATILKGNVDNIDLSFKKVIKDYCNELRNQSIVDVDSHEYSYVYGTIYTDIVNECEKFAGYVENVIEAKLGLSR